MNPVIDVAVVGCGHMGSHHARTVARNPKCRLVAAVDVIPERAQRLASIYGAEARSTVPDGVDAVIVATPTASHVDVALPHLREGRWCLVEKPLAPTVEDCRLMYAETLAVGHVERFNPAVRAIGALQPRYLEARRLGPASGRSQDIDVVLDLMIHDIDLVLQWSQGEVVWLDAVGVAVLGEQIDTCSVRLRTEDGMTASLVASRVAKAPERTLRVFEHGRYSFLDLRTGQAVRNGGTLASDDPRDALTAQLDAFVRAVKGEAPMPVNHRAGLRAVELADRIRAQLYQDLDVH